MTNTLFGAVLTLLIAGCATTPEPTAKQVAECKEMEAQMGMASPHDHSEQKGTMGRNAMNVAHDRCQQILRDAAKQPG